MIACRDFDRSSCCFVSAELLGTIPHGGYNPGLGKGHLLSRRRSLAARAEMKGFLAVNSYSIIKKCVCGLSIYRRKLYA